jgi:hypothetical protein
MRSIICHIPFFSFSPSLQEFLMGKSAALIGRHVPSPVALVTLPMTGELEDNTNNATPLGTAAVSSA